MSTPITRLALTRYRPAVKTLLTSTLKGYTELPIPEWGTDTPNEHSPIPSEDEISPLENRASFELWSALHALKEDLAFAPCAKVHTSPWDSVSARAPCFPSG
jgi:hypothetical protein